MKKYLNNIPHNSFFLVFCEFLARYDKVLELHLAAVEEAQASHRRMQVTTFQRTRKMNLLSVVQAQS